MKCQARACHEEATHVYVWRTPTMPAPSFWYGCEREAMDWLNNYKGSPKPVAYVKALSDQVQTG